MTTEQSPPATKKPPASDSSVWRLNRSNVQTVELANAIRSLGKVVGLLDQQTKKVGFNRHGKVSYNDPVNRIIRIDPTFALKETPISDSDFDVLVGLAVHESMHTLVKSEEISVDYKAMTEGLLTPNAIAAVGEEVVCDQSARRSYPVAFGYLRKAREAYKTPPDKINWDNPLEAWANVSVYGVLPPPDINSRTMRALRILTELSIDLSKKYANPRTRTVLYREAAYKLQDIQQELETEKKLQRQRLGMQPGESWGSLESNQNPEKGQPSNAPQRDSHDTPGDNQDTDSESNKPDNTNPTGSSGNISGDSDSGSGKPQESETQGGEPTDEQSNEPASNAEDSVTDSVGDNGYQPNTNGNSAGAGNGNPSPADVAKVARSQNNSTSSDGNPANITSNPTNISNSMAEALQLDTGNAIDPKLEKAINEAMDQQIQDLLSDLQQLEGYHDNAEDITSVVYQRVAPDPEPLFDENLYNQLVWIKLLRNSMGKVTHRGLDHGQLDLLNLHRAAMDGNAFKRNKRLEHQKARLVLLLDASGSMGNSANPVYRAAAALHKALPGEVSVYSYNGARHITTGRIFGAFSVSIKDHSAHRQFDKIIPRGGTPSGVAMLATAQRHKDSLIVHFTDGESNIGISPVDAWQIIDREFPKVKIVDIRLRKVDIQRNPFREPDLPLQESDKVKVINLRRIEEFAEALKEAIKPWAMTI